MWSPHLSCATPCYFRLSILHDFIPYVTMGCIVQGACSVEWHQWMSGSRLCCSWVFSTHIYLDVVYQPGELAQSHVFITKANNAIRWYAMVFRAVAHTDFILIMVVSNHYFGKIADEIKSQCMYSHLWSSVAECRCARANGGSSHKQLLVFSFSLQWQGLE